MAQWAVRSTPCKELNGRTPFEVVTGLKPQGPLHELFHRVESTHLMTINSYVRSLQEELRKIHGEVERYLEENYDEQGRRDRARNGHPGAVQTGDFVFLKKAPKLFREETEASDRLNPKCYTKIWQVADRAGHQSVVLMDPDTGSRQTPFSNPVHISSLVRFDLPAMEAALAPGPVPLEIRDGANSFSRYHIVAQNSTGSVRVKRDSDGHERIVDLAMEEYRWC